MLYKVLCFILLAIFANQSLASKSFANDLTGFIVLDSRLFFNDPAFVNQKSNNGLSLALEPEYYHVSEDNNDIFTFRPFYRLDQYDSKRTHGDVRQLDWLHINNDLELRLGVSKVFWGVLESNHLVDIINQTDFVEDFDAEDKLGQPMIQLALIKEWGTLRFFYLPYFRERTFAGKKGRLRTGLVVDYNSKYDSSHKQLHPDLALRYENSFGNWDISLAHFSGTGREPSFIINQSSFTPHYDIIQQSSVDLQYTNEGWLWKLETIHRNGQGKGFFAGGFGFEYSFFDIKSSDADLGLLSEYHRDARDKTAPFTIFNHDLFLAVRLTLNDISDTQFLSGMVIDTDDSTKFYNIEASRRINDNWKAEFTMRFFANTDNSNLLSNFKNDDYMQLTITRYF